MPEIYPKNTNNNQQVPANPLDEKKEEVGTVDEIYEEKDREYLSFLQQRLENARTMNDQAYPEFNGKTRAQYYEDNEKIANTFLPAKKNEDDVMVSAGTVETKLDSMLSHINNLNLSAEVAAFDKENNRIVALGLVMEDVIHDTEIRDGGDGGGDEEKKMLRQRELLKQGTCYVQEEWLRKFETKKKLKEAYDGRFKDFAGYEESLELVFEGPSRNLLYGLNVYLGDITEFYIENQPFLFVIQNQDYKVAETRFGKFENWKYVKPGAIQTESRDYQKTIFDNKWRLTEVQNNQVEIIYYYDKPRDEFNILINGVAMMPIGFPLSAVTPRGEYNIAKQVFRVLNDKFAFGGSFVSSGSVQQISALMDEMLKLFVLKTRKSFTPSYVNTSGRVIDKKVLSPGRISMGFQASDLTAIGNEVQGVTAGEIGVLQELQGLINKSTVSDQFTGQPGGGGTTATEIIELQRQAKLTLGLSIAVCSLLEKKLAHLRLHNIIAHWFDPIGEKVVENANEAQMKRLYRKTNREVNIEGEGLGERMVIPTDELPDEEVIRQMELDEEREKGYPIRKIFLNAEEMKKAHLNWYINITQKEKETSSFHKLMFRELVADMVSLMNLGSIPNRDGLEEEFSKLWGKTRTKLFQKETVQPSMGAEQPGQQAAPAGRPNMAGSPNIPSGMMMT